jgi:enoyl-CoA hydratase/carnithine racemase
VSDAVRVERDGAVATVLLSRAERRNAVDGATASNLASALRALAEVQDGLERFRAGAGRHGSFEERC